VRHPIFVRVIFLIVLFSLTACSDDNADARVNLPANLPDLLITVDQVSAMVNPNGSELSVNYTVSNLGAVESGPFTIKLWDQESTAAVAGATTQVLIRHAGLAAAASESNSTNLSTSTLAGAVYAFVDSENTVPELSESNNESGYIAWSISNLPAQISRGPYLQMSTANSMVIRWRTNIATDSRINFSDRQAQLDQFVEDNTTTTEHEILLSGLNPNTRYYYSIGTTAAVLDGGDGSYFFETNPMPGATTPSRIWVIGDAGTANADQAAVYNAYKDYTGAKYTDLWLMLGDNAYSNGTDAQYQAAVFNMYADMLKQTPLYATLGNHDGLSADSATESGPYYNIFTLPRAGEAGGISSGTEAYYSFDYGNIHFVSLDSYGSDRSANGAMMQWLVTDLQNNSKEWLIAFWHHPPYSKGSHNSDSEIELSNMREIFLPVLESYGVDMVLTGHSHSYERSKLINGHYGLSSTFSNTNVIDAGDGRIDGGGVYVKQPLVANGGTVYAVAGSSGQTSGGTLNHPAMYVSLNELGSMILDIEDKTLDVKFIDSNGYIRDYFTLVKDSNFTSTVPIVPSLLSASVLSFDRVALSWSDNSNNETGFEIERSLDGISWSTLASVSANIFTYTSTGLTASTTYYYRVRAVNNAGASGYSNSTAVTTIKDSSISTINLQQDVAGYVGTEDTYVSSGAIDSNWGTATSLLADGDDGSNGRLISMIRWDVSSIPANISILQANITLQVTNASSGSYAIYVMNGAWDESSTWNSADPINNMGTLITTFTPTTPGQQVISLGSVGHDLISNWISGAIANNGILIVDQASSDGLDVASSENPTIPNRPKLTLIYQ